MSAIAVVFAVAFVAIATLGVALILSVLREAAWQGSPLRLPVKSRDEEVIRHVHRASVPILGALVFVCLAHAITLFLLVANQTNAPSLIVAVLVAGVVTVCGLSLTLLAYTKRPNVKQ